MNMAKFPYMTLKDTILARADEYMRRGRRFSLMGQHGFAAGCYLKMLKKRVQAEALLD